MDGVRYRSYVVRVWLGDPAEPAGARVRVEWIARGIEVEARGARAADLAARLDEVFGLVPVENDGTAEDPVAVSDRWRH